jgi:hypothetical protein
VYKQGDSLQIQLLDQTGQVADMLLEAVIVLFRFLAKATTNMVDSDDSSLITNLFQHFTKSKRPRWIAMDAQYRLIAGTLDDKVHFDPVGSSFGPGDLKKLRLKRIKRLPIVVAQ